MEQQHLIRQQDIIPAVKLGVEITIIGAGATGSMSALLLAKCGFGNLRVYDFDTVDDVNINSQFYRLSDIGRPKVEALRDIVRDFSGTEIQIVNKRWEGERHTGIVIVAADSMAVRRSVFETHHKKAINTRVIDPRMGAESFLLYTYSTSNGESYANSLYSDQDALQEPCTAKATSYCAGLIGGHIVATVKSMVCDLPYPKFIQGDIPKGVYQQWNT